VAPKNLHAMVEEVEDLSLVVWGGLMEVEVGVVMAFCSWVEVVALLALFDLLCVQVVEVVYLVGHFVYYYRPEKLGIPVKAFFPVVQAQ